MSSPPSCTSRRIASPACSTREAIGYTPPIEKLLREHCGPLAPRDYFGMDITRVTFNPTHLPRSRFTEWLGAEADATLASGEVDEWGGWRRKGDFHHFAHLQPTLQGIPDLARLETYPWPDLDQPYRWQGVLKGAESYRQHFGTHLILLPHEGKPVCYTVQAEDGRYELHGGGDAGLVNAFYDEMTKPMGTPLAAGLESTVQSHLIAFAAEESRLTGRVVELSARQ